MENKPLTIKINASHREEIRATQAELSLAVEGARKKALEQALSKANASALKVAASLGVRLLGIHSLNESVQDEEPPVALSGSEGLYAKTIEARVKVEYRVSGFSQARIDFMMLRASNNIYQLLKKEFSTRWFQFRFRAAPRSSERASDVAGLPGPSAPTRALVAGHFSIPGGGGTFGDIEAQEMVCEWLSQAGIEFDVASNNEDGIRGVNIEQVDEGNYGIFIFVCGPWYPQKKIPSTLLAKFKHCVKIGVNLTIFEQGSAGFDYLLPRDSLDEMRADIAFARKMELLPVAGILLIERQKVYGVRQRHRFVKHIINEYLESGETAPIWLDTVANHNSMGIKTARQFESIVRKTDLVITNRLHGLVLSLKNSVPVIAIDAVAGGGKVTAQAKTLGWPLLIPAEDLSVEKLSESVRICLGSRPHPDVQKAQGQASASIEQTKNQFLDILQHLKPST